MLDKDLSDLFTRLCSEVKFVKYLFNKPYVNFLRDWSHEINDDRLLIAIEVGHYPTVNTDTGKRLRDFNIRLLVRMVYPDDFQDEESFKLQILNYFAALLLHECLEVVTIDEKHSYHPHRNVVNVNNFVKQFGSFLINKQIV